MNQNKWEERGKKWEERADKMDKAGQKMQKIGKQLTIALTIPIIGFFIFGFAGLIIGIVLAIILSSVSK